MLLALTSAVLLEATVTFSVLAEVNTSFTVKASAEVEVPLLMNWLATDVIVGAVLTVTLKKVAVVMLPPFIAMIMMVDVPVSPGTGVTFT